MAHIHTKTGEHDHTVSAYIVRADIGEPKLLMHLHKKLGKYIQFGGHIETHENPWQAIVHEVKEESGYDMSQLKILQPRVRMKSVTGAKMHPVSVYHQTHNFDATHYHTDSAYAFVATDEPSDSVGRDETEDIKLFSRSELVDLPAGQTIESVREAGLFVLDVCLREWETVDTTIFD